MILIVKEIGEMVSTGSDAEMLFIFPVSRVISADLLYDLVLSPMVAVYDTESVYVPGIRYRSEELLIVVEESALVPLHVSFAMLYVPDVPVDVPALLWSFQLTDETVYPDTEVV